VFFSKFSVVFSIVIMSDPIIPKVNQTETAETQSVGNESMSRSSTPPPFKLEAAPIQKQEAEKPTTENAPTAVPQSETAKANVTTDATTVTITYGPNANKDTVKASAETVIKELVAKSGGKSCKINSTARTPEEQARAMYSNLVGTGQGKGVEAQRKLYGAGGEKVIDTFVAEQAAKKTPDEIKAAMTTKIKELGPSNVSNHCADSSVLCVVDIDPGSITNGVKFAEEVAKDSRVSKFFKPPADPAYHLEIPVT
jgi:hypothetical protein